MDAFGALARQTPADLMEPSPKARILLVDDDERNLMALSHVLRDIAEVVTTSSGRDALRHLLNGDYAVILLDVFMPGMDGYEVASLIRQREQTARIPIIFLSAVNKETEHLMRGYAMGAVDYVFKPVDPTMLKSKVSVFVDLYEMRLKIEAKNKAEQELREANYRVELERLQMEAELQASRARQAALLEMMPLALFEAQLDAAGALVRRFVGGNLARIIGADDARAIEGGHATWEERIHAEDIAALVMPRIGGDRQDFAHEYRWQGRDGSSRHFIEHCVLVDHAHSGRHWAGTLIDVTERKQLEAQLLQAGKIDAIGKLTGGVAHDFNNLLAVILGGIDLLQRRIEFGPRDRPILEQMGLAANKGADLVKHMMAFARKQDLTPVSIPPASVCDSVSGLVHQTLGGTVTVEWLCDDTPQNFYADRSQLELALLNLIINARDAMPNGGVIRVAIGEADEETVAAAGLDPRNYLCITVSDQGTGIPPELIEKITEPFFTTKGLGKGTGLGLSMVTGFVQQSGGKMLIRSTPGEGATVELILPSTEQCAPEEKPAQPVVPGQPHTVRSILLVDDDDAVRTVIGEQLRDMGVEVAEATNGFEALDLLSNAADRFDLILTDFAMPQISGLETIDRARRLAPNIRAAIMTGYADERLDEPVGAINVLRKPVSAVDLERVLD